MINAKQELLDEVGTKEVELVRVVYSPYFNPIKMSAEGTLENVLPELDFNYDNGYGGQELYGYIWYTDGTWSERGEYDGSEWWEYKKTPQKDISIEDE